MPTEDFFGRRVTVNGSGIAVNMETDPAENQEVAEPSGMSMRSAIRCLIALCCSHLGAPYAAARVTIRYQLEGFFELTYVGIALVCIVAGAALAFRQVVEQPRDRKLLYGSTCLLLWIVVSYVQLAIAVDSPIAPVLLGLLWAAGTMWVPWSVWAAAFCRTRGILTGSLVCMAGTGLFWSLVEVSGLTGNAEVEVTWRQSGDLSVDLTADATNSNPVDDSRSVWNGYLGNDRDGSVSGLQLHEDWTANPPETVWRVPCGTGWSSFAATETTLFGQEQVSGEDCVTARDLKTGELCWVSSEERSGFVSGLGGDGPRATPTLHVLSDSDSTRTVILTVGPSGLLRCLDALDGSTVWQQDLAELFPGENLVHGVCASPLVINDLVIACPAVPEGPCLAAFRTDNGSMVWTCDSDWRSSYASPAFMTIAGVPQIVLHASPGVLGVNPSDGSVLWQFPWTNEWDNNATQPLQVRDSENDLIIATGYRGGAVRLTFSPDSDGLSKPMEVWKVTSTMRTKFCNLAQFGDIVVGLDNGILCGLDLSTGKRLWKEGRFAHGQILKVGEHLLVIAERGTLHLLKPGRNGHGPVAQHPVLDSKTWNHPILVSHRLILRNDREIVCLNLTTVP